jgi:hypothetical protein
MAYYPLDPFFEWLASSPESRSGKLCFLLLRLIGNFRFKRAGIYLVYARLRESDLLIFHPNRLFCQNGKTP